jgi:hypothetical protein
VHIAAWSGKGAVRNYGDANPTSIDPLPTYYNKTLGTLYNPTTTSDFNYWTPSNYSPELVVVMLGSNDYSTEPHPSDEQFTGALTAFAQQIQHDYPAAKLLLMCSPSANVENQCRNINDAATQTGAFYLGIPADVYVSYGCDGHPSAATQENIASNVIPMVQSILGI